MRRVTLVAASALALTGQVAFAQKTPQTTSRPLPLDRRTIPTPAKNPELHVPTWTSMSLSNGAKVIVSERHGLPLVSFQTNFIGGAAQYEPAEKTGLASFVASMLSEGTTHRTGEQLSSDLQLLGTNIGASIGSESGRMSFLSTKDKMAPTLAILADVLENPVFPQAALDRLQARTIVGLTQNLDRTSAIANIVFPKVIYTPNHPYGRTTSETSVKAITRDELVSFHKSYFQPAHAVITVVGDVKADEVKQTIEKALAGWKAGGSMPSFDYPAPQAGKPTTIFLVDKPGAAQSTFTIGSSGPPRSTADYYALRVMNEMLGVLFQSRLNHNLREVKGYTYGVGSNFAFGRGPGAFRASGDIVTAKTDSALIEFMKELRDIRGPRAPSDDEMAQAKASLVQSLPASFESVSGVNGSIASIYTQGLPDDYYQQFARAIEAVTKEDVVRVAQKYIDPEHLAIVIVGDREKIEGPLTATRIAPIVRLDVKGDPIADKVRP
jgi:zinc protease